MKQSLLALSMLFIAASACLPVRQASADMVEVKGNIMNGEVVSDDGKKIEFKDAKGKVHSIDKKDVGYMQIDKADTGKPNAAAIGKTLQTKAKEALEAAKKAPEALKKATDGATKSFTDTVGKPLDRSGADGRAAQLAQAMDEANQASAKLTGKVVNANHEIARQQNEAKAEVDSNGENRVISKPGYVDNYDAKKGRFGTL